MNNDKIVRTITVKTPKKNDQKQEQKVESPQIKPDKDLNISKESVNALDAIFEKSAKASEDNFKETSSDVDSAIYKAVDSIDVQTDLIRDGNATSKRMLSALSTLGKGLKAKVKSSDAVIQNSESIDDSTIGSITKSVSAIEKRNAEQLKASSELNDSIKGLIDDNQDSTSAQVLGEDIHEELKEQGDHIEQQSEEDKQQGLEEKREKDRSLRTRKIVMKTLGFIGTIVSNIARTLLRFSVGAIAAAAKWGAILFAIVFGFDLLNRHLSHWFSIFNTSLEDLDESTGLLAPSLESIFNAFTEFKDYLVSGEYWEAFKSIFTGLFDVIVSNIAMIGVSITKMVAGLLRFIGAEETGDTMEANAIKGLSLIRNYRFSEDDLNLISKVESRDQEDVIKQANKKRWSDEQMALNYQSKMGLGTKEVDPQILERLTELRDLYKEGGIDKVQEANKDAIKTQNRLVLISKRAEQYSSKESRIQEFLGETQRLKAEVESSASYGGSDQIRDRDLKRIEDLEADLIKRLEEFKELNKPKLDTKDHKPTESIELISESLASNQKASVTNLDNKIQNNRNITNNNSIIHTPVQTSRDVPGMYRSMEVNA